MSEQEPKEQAVPRVEDEGKSEDKEEAVLQGGASESWQVVGGESPRGKGEGPADDADNLHDGDSAGLVQSRIEVEKCGEDYELSRDGNRLWRILKFLSLDRCFDKGVRAPAKGEALKYMSLRVPLSDSFIREQLQSGAAPRRNNSVYTSKYTIWTFIPLAAAYQFRRFVNAFFLLIVIFLVIGNVNPDLWLTPWAAFGTASYLTLIVIAGMAVEGYDDLTKHRGDAVENNQTIERVDLRTGKIVETTWGSVLPGDIVLVKDRGNFPADLIFLCSSSDKPNMCYIETSGIDGETNLKIKDGPTALSQRILANLKPGLQRQSQAGKEDVARALASSAFGLYEYEQPNAFLQFNGSITFPASSQEQQELKVPLEFRNLILRGSELRNTKWIFGLVAYAGHETKLSLSRKISPVKFSRIDILLNRVMLALFCIYLTLLCGVADLTLFQQTDTSEWWYFKRTSSVDGYLVPGGVAFFITFMILFSNWIPVSMVLLVELVNTYLAMLVNCDIKMYHPETNTAACCRSPTLSAEIGQITHFFSDKTGTLTRNEMKLVGLYVNRKRYGIIPPPLGPDGKPLIAQPDTTSTMTTTSTASDKTPATETVDEPNVAQLFSGLPGHLHENQDSQSDSPESIQFRKVLDLLVFLAVCHTVILETDEETSEVTLNSESPDEEAFVKGAAALGVKLLDASNGGVSVQLPKGDILRYEVLALNAFNSTRKRMSIVICRPDGSIVTMMKGADNFILSRLAKGQEEVVQDLEEQLMIYAWAGLRTLVMAQRELSESEYIEWDQKYKAATVAPIGERAEALTAVAELIESEMTLVGATAIEDQLQVGVPEAIQTLRDAGIQVWVLTGDKVETAINIGLSSQLLDSSMYQIELTSSDREQVLRQLEVVYDILFATPQKAKSIGPSKVVDIEHGRGADTDALAQSNKVGPANFGEEEETHKLQETLRNGGYLALVISGDALELLLGKQKGSAKLENKLLAIARACKVVLACRVSPVQKALIVEMVRYAPDNGRLPRPPVTLAIGDGANDVPMIQSAHVGVGISGHEGRQAVNASDFSIAQFRFAVRLLLIHGRLNYRRLSCMICFVCYSWIVYILVLFVYQPFTLWSGSQVYFAYLYTFFAPPLLNFAIVSVGWFSCDLSEQAVLANPRAYCIGAENRDMGMRSVIVVLSRGLFHVALIFALVLSSCEPIIDSGALGSTIFTAVFMVVFFEQLIQGSSFNSVSVIAYSFLFVAFLVGMSIATTPAYLYFSDAYPARAWMQIVLVVVLSLVVRAATALAQREWWPTPIQILQEQERILGLYAPTKVGVSKSKVLKEAVLLVSSPIPMAIKRIKKMLGEGTIQSLSRSVNKAGITPVYPRKSDFNFVEAEEEKRVRRSSVASMESNMGHSRLLKDGSARLTLTLYSARK